MQLQTSYKLFHFKRSLSFHCFFFCFLGKCCKVRKVLYRFRVCVCVCLKERGLGTPNFCVKSILRRQEAAENKPVWELGRRMTLILLVPTGIPLLERP